RPASKVILAKVRASSAASSGTVAPRPLGFCSVNSAGTPSSAAASTRRRALAIATALSSMAGMSRACMSITRSVEIRTSRIGMASSPGKDCVAVKLGEAGFPFELHERRRFASPRKAESLAEPERCDARCEHRDPRRQAEPPGFFERLQHETRREPAPLNLRQERDVDVGDAPLADVGDEESNPLAVAFD